MKKLLVLAITLVMLFSLVACGNSSSKNSNYKIAMITDCGDVDDESFNQEIYSVIKEFSKNNNIKFTYYIPAADSTSDRITMIDKAVEDGYNVIVVNGSLFGQAIAQIADEYNKIKFIAVDVSESDLDNYKLKDNVYCITFKEEIAGFMAGYVAVNMGYKHLAFLGGKDVPAVKRYGYGFVQGADLAASENNKEVNIDYAYGNQFVGDEDITHYVETWVNHGTEVVFACGGKIYTSAAEAAAKANGKVIGVDTDQSMSIDKYAKNLTLTSAMKGINPILNKTLDDLFNNDKWSEYGGKIDNLGLVSDKNVEENYLQLPLKTTLWNEKFTEDNYKSLVKKIFDGKIEISNDVSKEPAVKKVKVDYQGNIK